MQGDITELSVSSGNSLVASASNDCTIRVVSLSMLSSIQVLSNGSHEFNLFDASLCVVLKWLVGGVAVLPVATTRWSACISFERPHRCCDSNCIQT